MSEVRMSPPRYLSGLGRVYWNASWAAAYEGAVSTGDLVPRSVTESTRTSKSLLKSRNSFVRAGQMLQAPQPGKPVSLLSAVELGRQLKFPLPTQGYINFLEARRGANICFFKAGPVSRGNSHLEGSYGGGQMAQVEQACYTLPEEWLESLLWHQDTWLTMCSSAFTDVSIHGTDTGYLG